MTLGIMFPNTGREIEETSSRNDPGQVYHEPVVERLKKTDRTQALKTALTFVNTAVARRHVADSYGLASPLLRSGLSREDWATGEIPVTPFPAAEARVRVDYSFHNEVGLKLLLIPPTGAQERATTFNMALVATGRGSHKRWLVNEFTPSAVQSVPGELAGSSNVLGAGNGLAPNTEGLDAPLSAYWLLAPIGLLVVGLLIPAIFLLRSWRRNRRAYREYQATRPLDV